MTRDGTRLQRLLARAAHPVDAGSLVAFRVAFGLLMAVAAARFVASGWIEAFFVEPRFFFKFWGAGWAAVPPAEVIYAMFGVMALAAVGFALGVFYRACLAVFLVLFTAVELFDVTNYLNHYYLVSLLGLILFVLPLGRAWSVDAWRRPDRAITHVPAWMVWLVRFQVAVVYTYAAVAKMSEDWLVHAQPLNLWLHARSDFPLLGPWFERWDVALAMSWAGFLHDLLVAPLLLWRRSRPWAYVMLLGFHGLTGALFNIGLFPFIMTLAATTYFEPDWPRRVAARLRRVLGRPAAEAPPVRLPQLPTGWRRTLGVSTLAAYAALQVLMPLRSLAYPGPVIWREEGMRFSWKVLVREKSGSVTYRVREPSGREHLVSPAQYLTRRQEREMSGQPDLIVQLAHHVAADFRARGFGEVEVRAEALVSMNGRAPSPLVDPEVDLARVTPGLAVADWILPAPTTAPPRLGARPSAPPGPPPDEVSP